MGLIDNARQTGAYLNNALREAFGDNKYVAEVRGEGLLSAVEFAASSAPLTFFDPAQKIGPSIVAAMAKRDVIARAMPQGDIVGFAPPLCAIPAEVDHIVAVAKEAAHEVLSPL